MGGLEAIGSRFGIGGCPPIARGEALAHAIAMVQFYVLQGDSHSLPTAL